MSRTARKKSSTGIYHIFLRGINRQTIFNDEEDNEKFLQILGDCKEISGFKLFGYCLMGNHVHLLLQEGTEGIEKIFRRIGTRYVYWYNWKYSRSGHLFQDRYKSETVENDDYYITVLRYIHQNPQKAGLCKRPKDYRWSSYPDYIGNRGITDTEFSCRMIDSDKFVEYMNQTNEDKILDLEEPKKRLIDEELIQIIQQEFGIIAIMIQNETKEKRDWLLKEILKFEGVTTRQLSRVTGISTNIIWSPSSKRTVPLLIDVPLID
jgi:REP element-mobilizing transposase RayT